jgi:hypothetical protein
MYRSKIKIWVSAPPVIRKGGMTRIISTRKSDAAFSKCVSDLNSSARDVNPWLLLNSISITSLEKLDTLISGRRKWALPGYSMFVSSLPLIESVTHSLKRTRTSLRPGAGLLVAWGSYRAHSRLKSWRESKRMWLSIKDRLDKQDQVKHIYNYCDICGDVIPNNCTPESNCLTLQQNYINPKA